MYYDFVHCTICTFVSDKRYVMILRQENGSDTKQRKYYENETFS